MNDRAWAVTSCVVETLLYIENGEKNTDYITAEKRAHVVFSFYSKDQK